MHEAIEERVELLRTEANYTTKMWRPTT